jgi:hypothetical protein
METQNNVNHQLKSTMLNQVLKVKRDWTGSRLRLKFEKQRLERIDKSLQMCEEEVETGVISADDFGQHQLMQRLLIFTLYIFTVDEIDYFISEMLVWQKKMMTGLENFVFLAYSCTKFPSEEKRKEFDEMVSIIEINIMRGKFESNGEGEMKLALVCCALFFKTFIM